MSDFSIFDGAMTCISGLLAIAPAQYHEKVLGPAIIGVYQDIPEQYKWTICNGIPHQTKTGNVDFGPSAAVPSMCAKPASLAKDLSVRVCTDH